MYSTQIRGPRKAGERTTIRIPGTCRYFKVAINRPNCAPIGTFIGTDNPTPKPQITINGVSYAIMSNDILEFDNLYQSTMQIGFLMDVDASTVIDFVFLDIDD